jgi:glycosyltransferase involved in cell wall biosynthesis
LAAELQLKHVAFAGRVAPETISRYYASADIYLQSPNIDNMPASVLEAFAAGLPVVSTEAGGVPAILTHGEHGLLAPLDDHQSLAAPVLQLLDRPDYAAALARNALASCRSYVWPNIRDRWLQVYHDLLGERREAEGEPDAVAQAHKPPTGDPALAGLNPPEGGSPYQAS